MNFELGIDVSMIWPTNDMSWIWSTIIVYQCTHILNQNGKKMRFVNFDFGIAKHGI
jgi:hypothetical protein